MADLERVRAVVALIEKVTAKNATKKNPVKRKFFNMSDWWVENTDAESDYCGTSMCLAGWAGAYAKEKPVFLNEVGDSYSTPKISTAGALEDIDDWAREYLEFSHDEAEVFYATSISSVDELKSALNYYLGEDVFPGAPAWDQVACDCC
jgi:hypothetical protein